MTGREESRSEEEEEEEESRQGAIIGLQQQNTSAGLCWNNDEPGS